MSSKKPSDASAADVAQDKPDVNIKAAKPADGDDAKTSDGKQGAAASHADDESDDQGRAAEADVEAAKKEDGDRAEAADEQAEEAAPQKKSAAEVIAEMRDSVNGLRVQFEDMGDFVRKCRDRLLKQADEYRLDGMKPMLESMMLMHDLLFRQAQAMEAGEVDPDHFVLNLLKALEAEFNTHNIEVIRPQPGDEPELNIMKMIGTAKCPFWRKSDRVARVHSCGFALRAESATMVVRKAEVTVYRR